jgi:hypothetical protein
VIDEKKVLMIDGYYVTLGSSADYYEVGARAAENIYLDSVIIFLYVHLSRRKNISADPQLMSDRIPEHCTHLALHHYRSGQDRKFVLGDQSDNRSKHFSFSKIVKCTMQNVSQESPSQGTS